MKQIYFAGSIRGGRHDLELYKQIINHLQSFGDVLTEHIGHDSITALGEVSKSTQDIYARDLDWLSKSDFVVAEVSTPSLGVGFEVAAAVELKKKVLCLYRAEPGKSLSAMIAGCPGVGVQEYQTIDDAKAVIDKFMVV